MTTAPAQAHTLTAGLSDDALIESLRQMETRIAASSSTEERQTYGHVRIWIIDELERRYPEAVEAVGEAIDATPDGDEFDYAEALIASIKRGI
jgi:hypothetical protein